MVSEQPRVVDIVGELDAEDCSGVGEKPPAFIERSERIIVARSLSSGIAGMKASVCIERGMMIYFILRSIEIDSGSVG